MVFRNGTALITLREKTYHMREIEMLNGSRDGEAFQSGAPSRRGCGVGRALPKMGKTRPVLPGPGGKSELQAGR